MSNKLSSIIKSLVLSVAILLTGGAWAAEPLAMWDGSAGSDYDFSNLTHGDYTLVNLGEGFANSVAADYSYLQVGNQDQKAAIVLKKSDSTDMGASTVIIKCENMMAKTGANRAVLSFLNGNNPYIGVAQENTTGDHTSSFIWDNAIWNNNANVRQQDAFSGSKMTIALAYSYANGTEYYVDGTSICAASGLRASGYGPDGVCIGGVGADGSGRFYAMKGMKITAIAFFGSHLSDDDVASYLFPSDIQKITVYADTSVSAINAQLDDENYKAIAVSAADGVTITVDEAFGCIASVSSEGNVKLAAANQPAASYFSGVDFSGVQGALLRSWITTNVVGFNFNSANGSDVSGALATADSWIYDNNSANGTSTAMFADGLSTLTWASANTYQFSGSTILCGYLDDGSKNGNGAEVHLANVPYATYDIILYCSSDQGSGKHLAKTVNGTTYTWDSTGNTTVAGDGTWGQTQTSTPAYGTNTLRIKDLTGPLTIYGTPRSGSNRGGIAAFEIINTTHEATITSAGEYTLAGLFTSVNSDENYVINVNESATLSIASATTVGNITFNVASGKTLTLTGSSTLTATTINVNGDGMVAASSGTALAGTLKGDGTVAYSAAPTGVTLTDSEWEGVLWLKNVAIAGLVPANLASANSTLRLTGCTGYFNSTGNKSTCLGTLDLQDDGATKAFTVDNGWSNSGISVFNKLTGSGTLTCSTRDISQRYVFKDPTQFTGSINTERTDDAGYYFLRVILGDGESLDPIAGTITVVSGATATVAAGKTWNAWAINVNGTLNVGNGSTISAINTGSTGVVQITSAGTATISGVKDNAISSSLAMVIGNLAVVDTGITELTIPAKTGDTFFSMANGKLDLSGCTSLTTLKLNLGSGTTFDMANIILPASCETVNAGVGAVRDLTGYTISNLGTVALGFVATETREEYANGTFSVANVPANATVTVTRPDGTSTAATVTDGTARLADYGTVKISGAATVLDISYTNTFTIVYNKVSASSGHDGMWTSPAQNPTYNNVANDETTGMYIKWHPYMSSTGSKISEFQDHLTLAAVGTMSPTANRIFLHLGSSSGSNKGILILTGKNKDEVYIAYNSGKTITLITTTPMTVPNAATARHAYIVTKEDADDVTTFTVYLDGIKWKTTSFPAVTLGTSTEIQVGSDISGSIKNDASGTYKAVDINADTATETGVVNTIRLYDRIITSAEIAEYAAVYPYVSPNGSSSRTFTAAAENWIDTTESSEVWSNSDDTKTGTPLAGASLNVTAGVATEVTINLASETYYEALTIGGAATTFKAGTADIKVTGMTVIGSTVSNEYGAVDMTGGPMTITEDGDITFDYSSYDISDIYTTTDIPLTSDVDENSTKVHLVAPSAAYRTVSLVYKSGYYAMRVAPNHENGAEVYFKSGYLASNMNGTDCGTVYVDSAFTTQTVMFPNDKMVINDNSDLTNGKVWIKDDFVGNIRISRTSAMSLLNGGDASGAILDGVTITVDSGSTLNISKNDVEALNIGAATINGDGSVNIPSATTVSGAVSGTAALTISGTVNVASGGSIANAVAGTGTIAYAAIPAATPSSFTGWTGTVELPSFSASSGVNFNSYGTTGSTVALAGMTEGYILEVGKTVAPTLRLDGAMNITAMSSWTYTFAEITGTGNLSFPTSANSPNVTITKVAEGYSGTISSTLANSVTITTLAKAGGTSTASGTKLLSTGGTGIAVTGVTIGGEAQTLTLYYADDGVYVDGKVSSEGEGSSAVTTVTTDTETTSVSINLGDGYEGSVVVPPNVASVTTTGTSLATDKVIVKYGTTDISGAFTVGGSAGAITLALNANGSVTISDKTITVKPAVDTSDDPMTMPDETTAPAFNIKTIPGLWYVVRSGTSPSSLAAGDATQATTTTTGLAGPALGNEDTVRYYKISVGRTAAEAAQ